MDAQSPLKEPDLQFDFGSNWADFSHHLNETMVRDAISCLENLLPGEISGKTFLDIGCGSGLHALAALKLGAKAVTAIDVNPQSVATARRVLEKFYPSAQTAIIQQSILSVARAESLQGPFDIVYSWGVLHHTGHMDEAIARAASLVAPNGKLVIAIYKRSPLCPLWRLEKRIYTKAPKPLRLILDYIYSAAYLTAMILKGQNPVRYVKEYHRKRGMRWMTDVRDWLGGYPYESASAEELKLMLKPLGFRLVRAFNAEKPKAAGLFGCGCGEYVYEKKAATAA